LNDPQFPILAWAIFALAIALLVLGIIAYIVFRDRRDASKRLFGRAAPLVALSGACIYVADTILNWKVVDSQIVNLMLVLPFVGLAFFALWRAIKKLS
jgi:hypothetical protein